MLQITELECDNRDCSCCNRPNKPVTGGTGQPSGCTMRPPATPCQPGMQSYPARQYQQPPAFSCPTCSRVVTCPSCRECYPSQDSSSSQSRERALSYESRDAPRPPCSYPPLMSPRPGSTLSGGMFCTRRNSCRRWSFASGEAMCGRTCDGGNKPCDSSSQSNQNKKSASPSTGNSGTGQQNGNNACQKKST